MFRLSKKADYGLITLKHLTLNADGAHSAPEIARTYNIPPELLAKVLQRLVREGLLISHPGPNGGYALARDPEAIEGPVFLTPCEADDECDQILLCSIRDPLRTLKQKVVNVLVETTIHELATPDIVLEKVRN